MDRIFTKFKIFIGGGGKKIHRKYCQFFRHFKEDWR